MHLKLVWCHHPQISRESSTKWWSLWPSQWCVGRQWSGNRPSKTFLYARPISWGRGQHADTWPALDFQAWFDDWVDCQWGESRMYRRKCHVWNLYSPLSLVSGIFERPTVSFLPRFFVLWDKDLQHSVIFAVCQSRRGWYSFYTPSRWRASGPGAR